MTEKHAERQPFSIRLCNTISRMIGGGGKRESENESKVKKKEQRQSNGENREACGLTLVLNQKPSMRCGGLFGNEDN